MKNIIFTLFLILGFLPSNIIHSQSVLLSEVCLSQNMHDDRYASYSPDGSKIVFESNRNGHWDIYIMGNKGQNQQRITFDKGDDRRPSWHPSGKKILFESDRGGKKKLYVLNIKNKKIKEIPNSNLKQEWIFGNFSPNGKYIAVSAKESEDKSNILLLKKNGKIKKWLTKNEFRNYYPRWSPDGNEIIYFSRKHTDNKDDEIYRMNIGNGKESRLTNWPKHNFCPSWSSSGSRVVYVTSMEGTRPEIYIMDADGGNQVRVTHNQDGDTLPDWSPKGSKLLITGYRGGNFEICELELDLD
ncbi:MAG: hypothetical protein AAFZ15_18345 [Bacteroidota bacterium]